jgi:flagellar biosynthesis GTPase FlhF
MAGRIFINYRREDSRADARSVYQRLERAFGKSRLFMDVDTIQKGRDFTKVLDEHLAQSDVVLAIIGSRWLTAQDESGTRRLDDPEDFVRVEIARALKRDIAVIPVLVDGARMPKASELPDDLKPLSRRQASIVTHENFGSDVEALAGDLKSMQQPRARRRWLGGAIAAALLLAIAGYGVSAWIEAERESARQAALEEQRKAAEDDLAQQKAAEEAAARQVAQQKAAEEEAARQKAIEDAARQAAQEKAADEEAARQAAEQKAADDAARQSALQKAAQAEADAEWQAALQKAAAEEAARQAAQQKAAEDAARQAALQAAKQKPAPPAAAAPSAGQDDIPQIIVAAGDRQRFSVKMGSTAELTSNGIPIFVSQPDLGRGSIGIRIAGGGTRMGVGQEFALDVHGGGSCKLSLLNVTADEAGFSMRC